MHLETAHARRHLTFHWGNLSKWKRTVWFTNAGCHVWITYICNKCVCLYKLVSEWAYTCSPCIKSRCKTWTTSHKEKFWLLFYNICINGQGLYSLSKIYTSYTSPFFSPSQQRHEFEKQEKLIDTIQLTPHRQDSAGNTKLNIRSSLNLTEILKKKKMQFPFRLVKFMLFHLPLIMLRLKRSFSFGWKSNFPLKNSVVCRVSNQVNPASPPSPHEKIEIKQNVSWIISCQKYSNINELYPMEIMFYQQRLQHEVS